MESVSGRCLRGPDGTESFPYVFCWCGVISCDGVDGFSPTTPLDGCVAISIAAGCLSFCQNRKLVGAC